MAAVAPLRDAGAPVQLSLTGGKDSRLIAAALVKAGVPVTAVTHGFADHPDVVVAAEIARRLGIEHAVRTRPRRASGSTCSAGSAPPCSSPTGCCPRSRTWAARRYSASTGPAASPAITAGGHGGELLRGGYAETAGRPGATGGLRGALSPARRAARSAELLRRLTTKHLGLIRRGAAAVLRRLARPVDTAARPPPAARPRRLLPGQPGRTLVGGRAAGLPAAGAPGPAAVRRPRGARRQDRPARRTGARHPVGRRPRRAFPALADVPLAGKPPAGAEAPFDWRRQYGEPVASFLRGYILDQGAAGGLFDVVRRPAAEALLRPPHADRASVWALATLACLTSGDYRNAREPAPQLPVS